MQIKTDILIIGSGIAGLFSAIKASEYANVILVTKKNKSESNTNYAQGGIASVLGAGDSFDEHINDTLVAGAGLCNKKTVEILVKEGPDRIRELIKLGTDFTMKSGELDLAMEGGHSKKRIVHSKDLTGKEVERALIDKVSQIPNITVLEDYLAIDLITEHNISNLKHMPISSRHCFGAYVLDSKNKESAAIITIIAKATILATGGAGQVYLHTTNPAIATGDGIAMSYRAGAKVGNMEFIQFHPTSLYQSISNTENKHSFLISEAVRGFGGILKNLSGESFMIKYDPRKELAPRDIVARAIDSELKKRGEDYVVLDLTHKDKADIIDHFPNIYSYCLNLNIDITKDPIPVVPAAHYVCGGVVVDEFSRTSLLNLYAVGEVAMTGVHGANRLASNSLLEALVFAERAAIDLNNNISGISTENINPPDWDDSGTLTADEKVLISHSTKELKQLMWDYVGIVRSNKRLNNAARRIEILFEEVEEYYKKTKVFDSLIELRNLITCSHLIIKSASFRKESRGLHFTLDYPETSIAPVDTILQNTYQKS
ncbi:MAG: L-aspartate oxidase [Ignavibacteriaceae bacterium]|nr:L-aspartate oxidase [Ignavibacteriaceae bacterium]